MNWTQLERNWTHLEGNIREQWDKLSEDQIGVVAGKRDRLAHVIREAYGVTNEEAERQLADWEQRQQAFSRAL